MTTKSLNLLFSKIIGCPLPSANYNFSFSFYSYPTIEHIITKNIRGVQKFTNIFLNLALKFDYPQDSDQILLKIHHQTSQQSQDLFAEIIIELETWKERSIQYIPLRKNDRVLEIKLVNNLQSKECVSQLEYLDKNSVFTKNQNTQASSSSNDIFIKQKEDFLKRLKVGTNKTSKTFADKVYDLLNEVQVLKNETSNSRVTSQHHNSRVTSQHHNHNANLASFNQEVPNRYSFQHQEGSVQKQQQQMVKSHSLFNFKLRKDQPRAPSQMNNQMQMNPVSYQRVGMNRLSNSRLNLKNLKMTSQWQDVNATIQNREQDSKQEGENKKYYLSPFD